MKKQLLNKLFLIVLFFPVQLFAQDITGLWKGEMYVDSTKKYLPYEISISEVKGKLVGYSHISFEENGKMETGIRDITIDRKDDQVVIEDVSLIDNSFSFIPPKNIKKTMLVTLTVDDTSMTLKGTWSTNRTKRFLSATGSVKLQRKNDYKATVLYKRLTEIKLADQLVFNEPVKKIVPKEVAAVPKIENTLTPNVLINQDVDKKTEPAKVTSPELATTVKTINKPVENKISPPQVVKPAPTIAVAAKPIIEKPAPPKPPTAVIAISQPPEEKKAPPVVVKPAPTIAVAAKPVIEKPAPPKPPTAVIAISQPPEVKKAQPVVVKPAPTIAVAAKPVIEKPAPPVVKAPVAQEKPKEIVAVVPEKKPEPIITPSVVQGAADVNKRSIATTQSVYYQSDSLVLTLYDNGYVDGDTVSVVMNGDVIFSKQGLSTKAVSKTIYITKETPDSIKLVMYAENLGSIPPNTGLLVVHDGEAVYDVRFSADLKSNAAIILQRKKKE